MNRTAYRVLYSELTKLKEKKYNVGAICYDDQGRVLSFGFNSYTKTHPKQKECAEKVGVSPERCYLHAEVAALVKARKEVFGMIVLRVDDEGRLRMAKPCVACSQAIKEGGVSEVWYSDREGRMKGELYD